MNYAFPLAHAANTFATTIVMIALAIAGRSELAMEVGLVHAATLLTFQAFAGDARSLILRVEGSVSPRWLLLLRLGLAGPLALLAWGLSAGLSLASPVITGLVIARRVSEWIAELDLADAEFRGRSRKAGRSILLQMTLTAAVAGCAFLPNDSWIIRGVGLWALAPVWLSLPFLKRSIRRSHEGPGTVPQWRELLPHLGSTVILAATVYGFRSMILVLAGKSAAGDLVTAYSVGGLIASVLSIAAGPSLAFQAGRRANLATADGLSLSRVLGAGAILYAAIGALLCLVPSLGESLALATGKPVLFWRAVGASLIGGGLMLPAWRLRYQLLRAADGNAFGPDVLSNLMILLLTPLTHAAFGADGLAFSYLINGAVCLAFYAAAVHGRRFRAAFPRLVDGLSLGTVAVLFVPVFFQASTGLFRDPRNYFDALGRMDLTPFPVSVAACYLGLLLVRDFRPARLGLSVILLTTVGLILATLISCEGNADLIRGKMLLGLQFLLPMPAFVLGLSWGRGRTAVARFGLIALGVALAIVPLQLAATWSQGAWFLVPRAFFFSVYQHAQYVPTVIVGLWLIALFGLFHRLAARLALLAMAPLVAVYSVGALSLAAISLLVGGVWVFCFDRWRRGALAPQATFLAAIATATAFGFAALSRPHNEMNIKFSFAFAEDGLHTPINVQLRYPCWEHYVGTLWNDPAAWVAGRPAAPPRDEHASAHNFALDFAYNLGLPSLLPLAALVLLTLQRLMRHRRRVVADSALAGVALVTLVAVFADNLLKVGLRQPYPGIAGYFLWGLLMARLSRFDQALLGGTDHEAARRLDALRGAERTEWESEAIPQAEAVPGFSGRQASEALWSK